MSFSETAIILEADVDILLLTTALLAFRYETYKSLLTQTISVSHDVQQVSVQRVAAAQLWLLSVFRLELTTDAVQEPHI